MRVLLFFTALLLSTPTYAAGIPVYDASVLSMSSMAQKEPDGEVIPPENV